MFETTRISGVIPSMVGLMTSAGAQKHGGTILQRLGALKASTDSADL